MSENRPELTVQISEGGIDMFSASGDRDTVVLLLEQWRARMDRFLEEARAQREAMQDGAGSGPVSQLHPIPPGMDPRSPFGRR